MYHLALIFDDRVIASTSDETAIRIAAGLMAQRLDTEAGAAFGPINAGRAAACQLVANGLVG